MGYAFSGVDDTQSLNFGTFASAATFTVFARFKLATHGSAAIIGRFLLNIKTATLTQYGCFFNFDASGVEDVARVGFSKAAGTAFPLVTWNAGYTAGTVHTLIGTYDGADIKIYGDTDATPKASVAETGTPDAGSMSLVLGNINEDGATGAATLHGALFEVGWWAGTVLTGAQCAQLGAANAVGIPLPTHYWPLGADLVPLYGGITGSLSTNPPDVVAHEGTNLYPLAVAPPRRNLTLLGVS